MYGLNLLLLLMAAGAPDLVFGSGIVTGIGQTEATGTKHASGHAIVSGTGTADAVASKSAEGFAIVTGIGEPRAVSSEDFEGFGVVTGIGTTEAVGVKHVSGHGIVDGIGETLAGGAKSVDGSVEVVGISDMDATGIKAAFQPVITTGIGLPVGVGFKAVAGFAEVTGVGRIAIDGFVGGAANRITVSGNLRVTLDGDRRAYIAQQQAGGHVVVTGVGTGDVEGTKHTEGFGVVSGAGVPVAEGSGVRIFTTDFSEYATGSAPSDWTNRFAGSQSFTVETISGSLSGRGIVWTRSNVNSRLWSWDALPTDEADCEILMRMRRTQNGSSILMEAGAAARGGGSSGTSTEIYRVFSKHVGANTSTQSHGYHWINDEGDFDDDHHFLNLGIGTNAWAWMRVRHEGGLMRMKMWNAGSSEPGSWTDHTDNTRALGPGWIGLYTASAGPNVQIDFFGVAFDGATVPLP